MDLIRLGHFELRPTERTLTRDGQPLELGARAFDLLLVLIEHHGRLATKATLLERVWPRLVVDENNLPAQVASLRRVQVSALATDQIAALTTDQRGAGFPRVGNSTADIGSTEGVYVRPLSSATLPNVTTGGGAVYTATVVYTDGACSRNPGPGGWAWAVPGA